MTDKPPPPLPTPIALPSQPLPVYPNAVTSRDGTIRKQEAVEEEPYTIKCICDNPDDDGNTIFCETCETWQHIECYYPDRVEDALKTDFAHSCVECEPRPYDRKSAVERQKAKTVLPIVPEAADKKPKRPSSKSHKKKKPSEIQLNGHGHAHGAEPKQHHPTPVDNSNLHPPKKAKNTHKSSHSVSAPAPKRSPSYGNSKTGSGHPPSPATTPPDLPDDFEIHNYSEGFLSLFNDQHIFQPVRVNSFADLGVSNKMLEWLHNKEVMKNDTGFYYNDVFQELPPGIDSPFKGKLVEPEAATKISPTGTALHWQLLRAVMSIDKDTPLMEVNGHVGLQRVYCADPVNRWADFSSPLPFVFFHPLLPLYIDTRREGSAARCVRRSCRPNAILETYLSHSPTTYHFWLVSDRPIAAKEQITIPWDFRFPKDREARILQLLGLSDDNAGSDSEAVPNAEEYQFLRGWIHTVLSEYGGCACDLGSECAFVRFHRNWLARSQTKKTKKRKPKAQHAISPTSTGHATNSRAPSEGHLDDVPEHNERRSVSGSSRSKPPSRDLTPTVRQGSFDTLGILTEPTDRDKRKVAMVEDTFRRMEQQQPPRKRKRVSDGTTASSSHAKGSKSNSAAQTPNPPSATNPPRLYVNVGTGTGGSRSKSNSPTSPRTIPNPKGHKKPASRTGSAPAPSRNSSTAPHPTYVDAAVQTDPEPETPAPETPAPQRRVVTGLRKRALDHRHQLRLEEEERRKRQALVIQRNSISINDAAVAENHLLSSPTTPRGSEKSLEAPPSAGSHASEDIHMPDAPSVLPSHTNSSTAISTVPTTTPMKKQSPDLRVQMPPVPPFGSPTSATSTPISASAAVIHSPFSAGAIPGAFLPTAINGVGIVAPSPVKKKLSLSDYTRSRINKIAAAKPPSVGTTSLKPILNSEDSKVAAVGTASPTTTDKEAEKEKGKPTIQESPTGTSTSALSATSTSTSTSMSTIARTTNGTL
ncbi:SET domain-containing protein 3 [Podospora fimiseda]|uniref:SET domain-containing protein 3 n=1 Tax=Podospora fimiseda TaxID=252190 RepID=A0AAN7GT48_9PEZI|nr:SET domain-containing protein 3 [Podospora fimiseda]